MSGRDNKDLLTRVVVKNSETSRWKVGSDGNEGHSQGDMNRDIDTESSSGVRGDHSDTWSYVTSCLTEAPVSWTRDPYMTQGSGSTNLVWGGVRWRRN